MQSYRIYYNRATDAPHIWSVDEGSILSEINVHTVILEGGIAKTESNLEATYPEPKAWLLFFGELSIEGGCAVIRYQAQNPPQVARELAERFKRTCEIADQNIINAGSVVEVNAVQMKQLIKGELTINELG